MTPTGSNWETPSATRQGSSFDARGHTMVRVCLAAVFVVLQVGCSRSDQDQWDAEFKAVVERLQKLGAELRHDRSGYKRLVIGVGLRDDQVSDELLQDLHHIKKLQSLSLQGNNVTDSSLKVVGSLQGLQSLQLRHARRVTHTGMKELRELEELKTLILAHTPVTDLAAEELGQLASLRNLALFDTQLTDEGMKHVGKLTGLDHLTIEGNRSVTDAGVKALRALKDLNTLSLSETQLTDAGLKELREFPQLVSLKLKGTRVTDAGLRELRALPVLNSLDLGGTAVTDAGLKELRELRSLKWLNLQGTRVTVEGGKELREALPRCHVVQ